MGIILNYNIMTALESNICTIAEWMKSNDIEALIAELQIIADRKYQEEEDVKIYQEVIQKQRERDEEIENII